MTMVQPRWGRRMTNGEISVVGLWVLESTVSSYRTVEFLWNMAQWESVGRTVVEDNSEGIAEIFTQVS
jgi:hypothetical protein